MRIDFQFNARRVAASATLAFALGVALSTLQLVADGMQGGAALDRARRGVDAGAQAVVVVAAPPVAGMPAHSRPSNKISPPARKVRYGTSRASTA